ncbi:MAG: polyamine aminopropyltransferase, partial [Gammaproteobacteria bacterium]
MMQDNNWFTEACTECGTAFSLKTEEKLHEEQTPYQKIEIYLTKTFGKLMVIDGFVMLTERDNFIYHEMLTHPALFSHPNPENILIIGGGDCGTLREVSKHACVKKITQVEIDQRVTDLSYEHCPNLCENNNDPRIELVFNDAIKWVQDAENESLDLIIVDSTAPIGPAEGLFSTPYYRDCLRILKSDGLLVQQSES